ncbi:protein CELLULOSE SYNTHASE INTERACTIVE 1-like [Fagus crenata]
MPPDQNQNASDDNSLAFVAKEGNIGYLINSANDESHKSVFEEGGLGPLLQILKTGSMPLKEKASVAVEAITTDPENAWAISAYESVLILIGRNYREDEQ